MLEQNTICCAVVCERRDPLATANTSHNIGSLEFLATDFCDNFFASAGIRIFTIQVLVNSTLIDIYE